MLPCAKFRVAIATHCGVILGNVKGEQQIAPPPAWKVAGRPTACRVKVLTRGSYVSADWACLGENEATSSCSCYPAMCRSASEGAAVGMGAPIFFVPFRNTFGRHWIEHST